MRLGRQFEIALKNALGMPVEYSSQEFEEIKSKLDWDKIPEQRILLISSMFEINRESAEAYIKEAEAIEVSEGDLTGDGYSGVGSPMGRTDRITLYAAIRAFKPKIVIETGTAAGASSVYILAALNNNAKGVLHSIDAAEDRTNVARLVPDHLKGRYHLHAGNSLTVLDQIFSPTMSIDFFLHDSLHTYNHMMAEYMWALNHTKGECVLCSHDVLMGNVWQHFIKRNRIKRSGIIKNLGLCILNR